MTGAEDSKGSVLNLFPSLSLFLLQEVTCSMYLLEQQDRGHSSHSDNALSGQTCQPSYHFAPTLYKALYMFEQSALLPHSKKAPGLTPRA